MGYHLAKLAENITTISPRDFRVLNRMCWHSLDNPRGDVPARTYFGGWEALALLFPDLSPDSAKRAVARSIAALLDAGYLKPVGNPYRRQRQAYLITLPMSGG